MREAKSANDIKAEVVEGAKECKSVFRNPPFFLFFLSCRFDFLLSPKIYWCLVVGGLSSFLDLSQPVLRHWTTMNTTDKRQPSEQEVVEASSMLLAGSPSLGIAKILSHLQKEKNWSISEKRLKTILSNAGLRPSSTSNKQTSSSKSSDVPSSSLDSLLQIPSGVKAVYFDSVKGKGLVASRDFQEDEPIFTEDAFISAPPAHALTAVEKGELCTHCFAPLSSLLVVPCGKPGCQARFCNRLCQSRAQSMHHALLCSGQNSSIKVRSD